MDTLAVRAVAVNKLITIINHRTSSDALRRRSSSPHRDRHPSRSRPIAPHHPTAIHCWWQTVRTTHCHHANVNCTSKIINKMRQRRNRKPVSVQSSNLQKLHNRCVFLIDIVHRMPSKRNRKFKEETMIKQKHYMYIREGDNCEMRKMLSTYHSFTEITNNSNTLFLSMKLICNVNECRRRWEIIEFL